MYAEINDAEELEIFFSDYDLCKNCMNIKFCPLIQAVYQEVVIFHYSAIAISECGLYEKSGKKC